MANHPRPTSKLSSLNLALRAIMEFGVVAAFACWGLRTGSTPAGKVLLSISTPLIGFGFWGLVDFHQMGRWAEALRLIQELLISGLAAAALFIVGQPALGWALALLSIVHHTLVYLLGERLIKSNGGF